MDGGAALCGGWPSVEGRGGGRGVARVCAAAAPDAASARASEKAAIQFAAHGANSFYRIIRRARFPMRGPGTPCHCFRARGNRCVDIKRMEAGRKNGRPGAGRLRRGAWRRRARRIWPAHRNLLINRDHERRARAAIEVGN